MRHKFSVGDMASLISNPRQSNRPSGQCRIVSCLPYERGPLQYRVQADGETIERVVSEEDLKPSGVAATDQTAAREAVFGGVRVVRR